MKSIEVHLLSTFKNRIGLWHDRFGYLHYDGLIHLSRYNRVKELPFFAYIRCVSQPCLAGRQSRERFPKVSHHHATEPLELVHSNLVGSIKTPSLSGSWYFVVFTNDYTCKSWIYFMKTKSQTFDTFLEFQHLVEKELGKAIKTFCNNRGVEFLSTSFINYLKEQGITHQLTMPRTPQLNNVAKWRDRTIIK